MTDWGSNPRWPSQKVNGRTLYQLSYHCSQMLTESRPKYAIYDITQLQQLKFALTDFQQKGQRLLLVLDITYKRYITKNAVPTLTCVTAGRKIELKFYPKPVEVSHFEPVSLW